MRIVLGQRLQPLAHSCVSINQAGQLFPFRFYRVMASRLSPVATRTAWTAATRSYSAALHTAQRVRRAPARRRTRSSTLNSHDATQAELEARYETAPTPLRPG